MKYIITFTALFLLTIAGCKKDNTKFGHHHPVKRDSIYFNQSDVPLHYDEQFQFEIFNNGKLVPSNKYFWNFIHIYTHEDVSKIGSVDNNGLFKARKVGEGWVTAKNGGDSVITNVIVIPYIRSFNEPITSHWGADILTIRSEVWFNYSDFPLEHTDKYLVYDGNYDDGQAIVKKQTYFFENNRLVNIELIFKDEPGVGEDMFLYYLERYDLHKNENDIAIFNNGRNATIKLHHSDEGYTALYTPFEQGN